MKEDEEKIGKMMDLSLIFLHDLPKGANNSAADTTEPPDILENFCHDFWKLTSADQANPM